MDDAGDIKLELKNTMNQYDVIKEIALHDGQAVQLLQCPKLIGKL
jgi:hypothetical protein